MRATMHKKAMQVSRSFRNIFYSAIILLVSVCQLGWSVDSAAAKAANPSAQAGGGVTPIRWFVGLGAGTDPTQVAIEQQVVDDFNASHPGIVLSLEVVPHASARETLMDEISAGNAPDIVGPIGWAAANDFHGQWLDLSTLNGWSSYDTSQFPTNLVEWYHTDEGQVALPAILYPAAMYYNPALFDAAGLAYPPAHYGDTYLLDGTPHTWDWDTLAQVSKRLTLDDTGKNVTQAGFDPGHIVQYGFNFTWEFSPSHMGSYWQSGSMQAGTPGSYTAQAPDAWKAAWQWNYDGMWGSQPFIPNGPAANSSWFGGGNVFNSGHLAMNILPSWYMCCVNDITSTGGTFQFGAMPSYNGQVAGRVDADTFRILSASKHPEEAFIALQYLVSGPGADKLIVGSNAQPSPYGSFIPAIPSKRQTVLNRLAAQFPFVTQDSWDVLVAGLAYPDDPSADGYTPGFQEYNGRLSTFTNLLSYTSGLNLATEITTLEADLQTIFNRKNDISGNTGVAGVTLSYIDGGPKTVVADSDGHYSLQVPNDWSGTVTPSKNGYSFTPAGRSYSHLSSDWSGQNYTLTVTLTSIAAQDGWVLESSENSNMGGSINNTANVFRLGDDAANRQYRAILSFNTAGLPDNAAVTSAQIRIKQNGQPAGIIPFSVLGNLSVDIRPGPFGVAGLQLTDFNSAATVVKVGFFNKIPVGAWYTSPLNANGRKNINKLGLTQFRLYFGLDDNNNHVADYMSFLSGDFATDKPQLVITYTLQ